MSDLSVDHIRDNIRWDNISNRGSVYDTIKLVTRQANPSMLFKRIGDNFPDVTARVDDFKFCGKGQRPTPVASPSTLVEIAWLCPGRHAHEFRRIGAVTLCRALGGDLSLVDEIRARHTETTSTGDQINIAVAESPSFDHHRRLALEERRQALDHARAAFLEKSARMLRDLAVDEQDEDHRQFLEQSSKAAIVAFVRHLIPTPSIVQRV